MKLQVRSCQCLSGLVSRYNQSPHKISSVVHSKGGTHLTLSARIPTGNFHKYPASGSGRADGRTNGRTDRVPSEK